MQYKLIVVFVITLILISLGISAADDTVTLIVDGKPVSLQKPPVLVNGKVYAPLASLGLVGAKAKTDGKHKQDNQKVEITSADGRKFTCHARLINEDLMLPIGDIADELGTVANWVESVKTLSLRAQIKQVKFDGAKLEVSTSYPVTFGVAWWKAANRLIVHMNGVQIPKAISDLPIVNSTNVPIRAGSNGEVGTVVLDLPCSVTYKVPGTLKTSKISVSVFGYRPAPEASGPPPVKRDAASDEPSSSSEVVIPPEPELPPVDITGIEYRKQSTRRLDVYIAASGPVKYTTYMYRDPDRVVIDLSKAVLARHVRDVQIRHDILQRIRVGQTDGDTVRIAMDLTRVVGFFVRQDKKNNQVIISLELPKGAGGSLSEKTVVIDPGHGGGDSGAVGCDGWREKDSNLAIGLRVQKLLSDAGAAVLMTRNEDVAVDVVKKRDLEKRAEFAARHSADFIISIHSNSIRAPKSVSGIETYYHGRDPNGRALAHCVHSEIIEAADLPDLSVRSDYVLYQTGLGVLRNASERFGIPAVLVEVGYVNHPYDCAKIRNPEFQQRVAEAIVKGFKAYVEGNPELSPIRQTEAIKSRTDDIPKKPVSESEPDAGMSVSRDLLPKPGGTPMTTGPHRPGED